MCKKVAVKLPKCSVGLAFYPQGLKKGASSNDSLQLFEPYFRLHWSVAFDSQFALGIKHSDIMSSTWLTAPASA